MKTINPYLGIMLAVLLLGLAVPAWADTYNVSGMAGTASFSLFNQGNNQGSFQLCFSAPGFSFSGSMVAAAINNTDGGQSDFLASENLTFTASPESAEWVLLALGLLAIGVLMIGGQKPWKLRTSSQNAHS